MVIDFALFEDCYFEENYCEFVILLFFSMDQQVP